MQYVTDVLHFLVDAVQHVAEANRAEMHAAVEDFLDVLRGVDPKAPAKESAPADPRDAEIAQLRAQLAQQGAAIEQLSAARG